ncbi:hypothetical protein [Spirosoma foliorum]|uniref:Uncharacterized protein n=1 Tax=Spirosoma foliorum TaxID=2710596 RepID=A0A7G5GZW7_9BACT|nr:hypothetical protein [Spirosoma foliorum]QMW04409.1 hypothetical protein H3H32_05545 [Spirosoma foliorum]
MRKYVLSFTLLIALTGVAQAQDKAGSSSEAGLDWSKALKRGDNSSVETLTQQLNYYQKKSVYLSRHSKTLTKKLSQLDLKNKRLVFKVDELRRDSLQLRKILQDALNDNQQLVKSYETRIQGMAGELRALHDSLSDLRLVKRDMDMIKRYFDSALLAKREYTLPVYKVVQALNDTFRKANSPYQIKGGTGQELIVTEDFSLKRPGFLFLKSTVHIQGEYKLSLKPHPFDEGKTLVDCQPSFQRKQGKSLVYDSQYGDKVGTENRLFSYIDQAIYSNDLHANVSSHSLHN